MPKGEPKWNRRAIRATAALVRRKVPTVVRSRLEKKLKRGEVRQVYKYQGIDDNMIMARVFAAQYSK